MNAVVVLLKRYSFLPLPRTGMESNNTELATLTMYVILIMLQAGHEELIMLAQQAMFQQTD